MAKSTDSHNKKGRLHFSDLGAEGKLRLLDLAFHPLAFGIASIPLCGIVFVWWAQSLELKINGLLIWVAGYCLAAGCFFLTHIKYKTERKLILNEVAITKWLSVIKFTSLTHGVGLTLPLFVMADSAPFEFSLLYLVTVSAIIAAFATHLVPVLTAFLYLFIPCWGICLLLMPLVFPENWVVLLILAVIYAASMYRHATLGHQFFLKQIMLEDEGVKLAENYRLAKMEAESALQAKNQFLTTASHDLRQPVHAMGFLIESIVLRNQDITLAPALKDLKQSVRSVNLMFNSLLDLSRIESGKLELNIVVIDLGRIIKEVAELFCEEARAKNIEIRTRICRKVAMVCTDETVLRQSIMNLIHNALRYTSHGGILIAVRKRSGVCQVDVWDTGVGVASADKDKIYSPFFRSQYAWKVDSAGYGLGLSVVARNCEIMDCKYGFSSRLDRGSHFWLSFPSQTEDLSFDRVVNEFAEVELMQVRLSGNCLVLDDDSQVASAWIVLLKAWGVNVRCVESSEQAFLLLDEGFLPHVIFCDQRLRAGESGFDVLRALLECNPKANGAMISGEFNSPELLQAESEGYLVLKKPLEPEVLYAILSQWLFP